MPLTLGHIAYLNCVPYFRHLRQAGFAGVIRQGVPAELNRMLAEGLIDASPSSSFEYARNWSQYCLLPGLSISSRGPVKSVLLFSEKPLSSLGGQPIALTGESATSVRLLEILLREFEGYKSVDCHVPEGNVEESITKGQPALLIGDRALREAQRGRAAHIYDLGELWYRHTGLPFVFALWIVRREAAQKYECELKELTDQLKSACGQAFADLEMLSSETPEREWMGTNGLIDYWKSMSYVLDHDHLQGMELYFDLLAKYGFLERQPEIRFLV